MTVEGKKAKKTAEIAFARPVFSAELLTDDAKTNFDKLPAWQRHFIKKLIDHGDLPRAAQESGVSRYVKDEVDYSRGDSLSIKEALVRGGVTSEVLTNHLLDCLKAEAIKFDKHNNPIRTIDMTLKLRTLSLIFELRGDLGIGPKKPEGKDGVLDLFKDTPT